MNRLKSYISSSWVMGLTLSRAMMIVGAVPFGLALEIHHIFSVIDYDGHEHIESDLCQWLQQHTSKSLAWALPQLA